MQLDQDFFCVGGRREKRNQGGTFWGFFAVNRPILLRPRVYQN